MVEIRPYTPEFKGRLLDLLTHLWAPDLQANAAHFHWKHETNPYLAGPQFTLALHSGRVVGARGLFGGCWQIGGRRLAVSSWGDSVVAPDFRRQGIMLALSTRILEEQRAAGQQHVFHLSSGPATRPLSNLLGARCISLDCQAWEPTETNRAQRARLAEWIDAASPVSSERQPRPAEMAALVSRTARDGRIRHVRDLQYFEWRFCNPLARYQFFYARGHELEGYLVVHTSARFGYQRASIIDWEAVSPLVAASLLAAVLQEAAERVVIWSATLPDEFRSLLAAAGFAPPHEPGSWLPALLIVPTHAAAPWSANGRPLDDVRSWDVRMAYADSF